MYRIAFVKRITMNIVKSAMIGEKGEKMGRNEASCSHMASLMTVLVGKTYRAFLIFLPNGWVRWFQHNETLIALV